MAFNIRVLDNYFNNLETASAAINAMNIVIPNIRVCEVFPGGLTPDKVRKLLNLLPVSSLEVDMDEYWGEQHDILMALNHGRWLRKLTIKNCRDTLRYLPISVYDIEIIAVDEEVKAIQEIVKLEQLRRISLTGGTVDLRTLTNTVNRETWIEELEMVHTIITTPSGLCRSGARIYNLKTTAVKLNGVEASHDDIQQLFRE